MSLPYTLCPGCGQYELPGTYRLAPSTAGCTCPEPAEPTTTEDKPDAADDD